MSEAIKTYDPKRVVITIGSHIVTGYADDSFVSVDAAGDGMTYKVGCDGSVVRSNDPNHVHTVKLSLQQTSDSVPVINDWFKSDRESLSDLRPITIKDLTGNVNFYAAQAWPHKEATYSRGKQSGNTEYEIYTGEGDF